MRYSRLDRDIPVGFSLLLSAMVSELYCMGSEEDRDLEHNWQIMAKKKNKTSKNMMYSSAEEGSHANF